MIKPRFADYHRTIIGYHGTKKSVADQIILGQADFTRSENDHDWLGHGVYFWEYAPEQAWWWAKRLSKNRNWNEDIAVVASMIRLGHCLDLLDPHNVGEMQRWHASMVEDMGKAGIPIPENANQFKRLDCAVFEYAYAAIASENIPIQTARAVYVPKVAHPRAWKRSWISRMAHIQLCVRDTSCILGTWLVKPVE